MAKRTFRTSLRPELFGHWLFNLRAFNFNSMEQSPTSTVTSSSATEEIPRILGNPKVHYSVHNSQQLTLFLSQINQVHTPNPIPWRNILILSPNLSLGFSSGLFTSFRGLCPSKRLVNTFLNTWSFYDEELLTSRLTPKLEDHPLSLVRDCLFNIFATNRHIWRPSTSLA
jgi:hypothetical protein